MTELHLVPYDPSWPAQFDAMAAHLRQRLGNDLVLAVEHLGSTAIPGMPAKPIIDIGVAIRSFDQAQQGALPQLTAEGWEYCWRDDRPPGHMMFIRRDHPAGRRSHHVHMAPREHVFWQRLAFRDYLIAHVDEAERYAALKREMVARHARAREAYTDAKSAYVEGITARALAQSPQSLRF